MKNRFTLIIVCSLFVFNCSYADGNKNSDTYISNLANDNFNGIVVVPITKNDIRLINSRILFNVIYSVHYKDQFASYKIFVNNLVNNNIRDIVKYIKPQKTIDKKFLFIYKEYSKKGLSFIIDKYLIKDDFGNLFFKAKYELSIVKIMFENNYYIYFDDYRGIYIFNLNVRMSFPPCLD